MLLSALSLTATPGVPSAWAQSQLVEKFARVEVPVFEDNLDDAKSRALAQGQFVALHSLVEDLLAAEWITLFDKELRRRIYNRVDRYVASYRVQRLETSIDRTRYVAALSAQINRVQLTEDLHELSLPVQGDPLVGVTLLYARDDPALSEAPLRTLLEQRLHARLALLNYRVEQVVGIDATAAEALGNALGPVAERLRALGRFPIPTPTALLVTFERAPAPVSGQAADVGAKANAWLYYKSSGELLAGLEQLERSEPVRLPGRTARERERVVARLLEPLVIQMQPGAIRSARARSDKDAELRLRVLGLASVEEQEQFEQAFFKRNSPFERFSLFAFASDGVTYRGPYGGDRAALERELRAERIGDFRVRHVYWYNDVLELDVERSAEPAHTELRLFPRPVRQPEVTALLDDFLTRYTQLEVEDPLYTEVEDNGWLSRANPIPFNATVYAHVDSRSDSDVYVGEALASGETVVLIWQRVGRTNLTPAIRLYDESGVLVQTFTPRTWLRYEYKVPKGQHRFYMEVGDRFGYLRVDTGGYLDFHYLFKMQRSGP